MHKSVRFAAALLSLDLIAVVTHSEVAWVYWFLIVILKQQAQSLLLFTPFLINTQKVRIFIFN